MVAGGLSPHHAVDGLRQLLQRKRLAQQMNAGIEGAVVNNGIARIAGGEEYL
jgi:hypothetical protein